jgi:hypothetical protein
VPEVVSEGDGGRSSKERDLPRAHGAGRLQTIEVEPRRHVPARIVAPLSSGVYFVRATANGRSVERKLDLIG